MANKSDGSSTETLKQLKIFLNPKEHAVVTMAAHLQGKGIGEYLKLVVIAQAKKDAREMNKLIDEI